MRKMRSKKKRKQRIMLSRKRIGRECRKKGREDENVANEVSGTS